MPSFFDLFEGSQAGKDNWFKPAEEGSAGKDLIKKGLEIRADREDGETFWDDFIAVIGQNTDDAAKFLEVSRDRIAKWAGKIRKSVEVVRRENEDSETKKKKSNMLNTGDK